MKPIVIYTMPRTKGTAVLSAAKREVKLNEPIEIFQLANINDFQFTSPASIFETKANNQSFSGWEDLKQTMSSANTASKFFGSGLQQFYPARKWFSDLCTENKCDLYILLRNPKDVLWSFVLALHYGFNFSTEIDARPVEVSEFDLYKADLMLDNFLRFYPSIGNVITFETLPKENFDYSLINIKEQNSINKQVYITNKDHVDKRFDLILKFYEKEWEDKTGTNISV